MGEDLPFVNFGTNVEIVTFYSGDFSNCAITSTLDIKCFGNNNTGLIASLFIVLKS